MKIMLNRIRRGEEGFTLIELLVVILIIGILLAVAAPSFLGQQKKAYDSKAKQALAVAYKQAKATATDNEGSFVSPAVVAYGITTGEPELSVLVGNSFSFAKAQTDTIVVVTANANGDLSLADQSKSGTIQTLVVTGNGSPTYGTF